MSSFTTRAVRTLVAAAADFSTEAIWQALYDEHCPPGDICPHG